MSRKKRLNELYRLYGNSESYTEFRMKATLLGATRMDMLWMSLAHHYKSCRKLASKHVHEVQDTMKYLREIRKESRRNAYRRLCNLYRDSESYSEFRLKAGLQGITEP